MNEKLNPIAVMEATCEIDYILAKFHFPKEDKIEILKSLSERYENVETYEPLFKYSTNKRLQDTAKDIIEWNLKYG